METSRVSAAFRPSASPRSVATALVLTVAVAASEIPLFFGRGGYTIWAYSLLLVGLSLAPLVRPRDGPLFQAFALIPALRLVNLAMPIFTELTLFWLPLVYGPFVPVVVYLGWRSFAGEPRGSVTGSSPAAVEIGHDLPRWLGGTSGGKLRWAFRSGWELLGPPEESSRVRTVSHWAARVLFAVFLAVAVVAFLASMGVLVVSLAEIEYGIITPAPLVPSLDPSQIAVLAVVMIGFVGFVEELLFRGILQQVLERRLGLVPGLVLASGIFALMHSGYGVRMELAFAGGIGLLFGVLYDLTDSLVLVAVMHGLLNVLVFGVIPLNGGSAADLLRAVATDVLEPLGVEWLIEILVFVSWV